MQYALFAAAFSHAKRRCAYAPSAISLSFDRHNTYHCDRPANSHQEAPNSLSSLSRAGSTVIQQDNTRHQPRSASSSIKPHRRLHLNTRAPNVSHHFGHTPQPPAFLPTTNTLPQAKPPCPRKRASCFCRTAPQKPPKPR